MHRDVAKTWVFIFSLATLTLSCIRYPERSTNYLTCSEFYTGEAYWNTFVLSSTCWEGGDTTFNLRGYIPDTTPETADVEWLSGPKRELTASVRKDTERTHCLVDIHEQASDVTCTLRAPPMRSRVLGHGLALSCTKGEAPADCTMTMIFPPDYELVDP